MEPVFLSILGVTTLILIGLGVRQRRRQRALAGMASRRGLKFAARDPLDLPRRYARWALMQIGHSPTAANVLFGRWAGAYVRAFDFRCEVGHGPHRLGRRFTVVAADLAASLPDTIAWRLTDPDDWPILPVWDIDGPADEPWGSAGNEAAAACIRRHWADDAGRGVFIEARGRSVLFATPGRLPPRALRQRLEAVAVCLAALREDSVEVVGG